MLSLRAKTVAVIGAGPSGLAAAKYLRAEKAFDRITVFEQRSRVGGIWNYTPDAREDDLCNIPQTDPRGKNQDPVWKEAPSATARSQDGVENSAAFLSPMYEKLETNIPRGLMGFQDLEWPEDSQLFPKHETVLDYIEEYGKDVQDLIQFETQVINVEPLSATFDSQWTVRTRPLHSTIFQDEIFDAVIVANGHFIVPFIPDIEGIKEWNEQYPGSITHSKYFRRPEEFSGKRVIVVGNSASGLDISTQIASFSQQPLLWSSKSTSQFGPAADIRKRDLPPIARFLPSKNRAVEFEDGTIEKDIDAILFATGYFYSLPFLHGIKPPLITEGSHVEHTYQHLFYAPQPTLSFLALPQRVIPFPIAEAQSAVLSRVYSGRLCLPSYKTLLSWYPSQLAALTSACAPLKNFHLLPFPKDGNYINELSTWALTATPREGLVHNGVGKKPPLWGEWEFWCRENFPAIRAAFGKLGEARYKVRTLEEVGFRYEDHLKRQEREEAKIV
ncbi:hypothetical protein BDV95DRAFT_506387 [Massariosphaeria phaeospora]|uniref:Flavin dependent monooxygenase n=1 Tax=Massariosphaeria phaeospora TaxID=100035 RepID=A0A7C8M093_9PLEO|nr:hypothetical protein BDV95DRAFT_506387 [Massariosphaeria phaeospora]